MTTTALAALTDRIAALHRYDQPVMEPWPGAVSTAAADWVIASTHD